VVVELRVKADMQFGLTMFPADFAIDVVRLGRAAEELGFESLFFPEHTHIPVGHDRRADGSPLPTEYAHALDPFVALSAVAAVTQRLKLGTGICLVIQRDPIVTAKEVASLDRLSHGRFLFGIGAGWNSKEIAHHGTDPKTRWRLLRERLEAMQRIWSNDEAEFHGQFVNFDPIMSWPKPDQQPRPPILLGGDVPRARQRVVEFADGWIPHPFADGGAGRHIADFHALCDAAGRERLPVTIYGGSTNRADIERYAAAGAARWVFRVPASDADTVLPYLEQCAAVARSVAN
jgi:probable F420-dependent oxidoreductase